MRSLFPLVGSTRRFPVGTPLRAGVLFLAALAMATAAPSDSGTPSAPARPPRDPFWPLDYAPPPETPPAKANRPRPAASPSATREISDQDWAEAEKAAGIRPARYSLGTSAEGAAFLLFQGKIRSQGGLVTQVWKGVQFQWRISEITESRAVFERLDATSKP